MKPTQHAAQLNALLAIHAAFPSRARRITVEETQDYATDIEDLNVAHEFTPVLPDAPHETIDYIVVGLDGTKLGFVRVFVDENDDGMCAVAYYI